MFQKLRRSMRRKKASYCINCGHWERDCFHHHGDHIQSGAAAAGARRENVYFNSLPNRRSIRAFKESIPYQGDVILYYDDLVRHIVDASYE